MTLPKAETHTNIMYGNTNYQQLAQMNSVTKSQVIFLIFSDWSFTKHSDWSISFNFSFEGLFQKKAWEDANPGETYIDRALELMKNSGAGKFTLTHMQLAEDNANGDAGTEGGSDQGVDFDDSCNGTKGNGNLILT